MDGPSVLHVRIQDQRLIWNQKVEPRLGWLWKEISPPISFTSFWVITSPSPSRRRREMLVSARRKARNRRVDRAPEYRCRYPDPHFNLDFVITEPFFDQNVDVAALGELNRVAHQVGNDLLQAQRVADDVIRHIILILSVGSRPFIMR